MNGMERRRKPGIHMGPVVYNGTLAQQICPILKVTAAISDQISGPTHDLKLWTPWISLFFLMLGSF